MPLFRTWFQNTRKLKGFFTQQALSEASGVSIKTISDIETTGIWKLRTQPVKRMLAQALGVSLEEMERRAIEMVDHDDESDDASPPAPPPESKTGELTIRIWERQDRDGRSEIDVDVNGKSYRTLPPDLVENLALRAEKAGVDIGDYIVEYLRRTLRRPKRGPATRKREPPASPLPKRS